MMNMFRRNEFPHRHLGFIPPPMPFRHESFNELRELFVLWLLNDEKEGITGYKLQTRFNIPRGTVLRIFENLEKNGFIVYKEETIEGRNQKLYFITDLGREHLNNLREKWSYRFSEMSDLAPPERFGHPFWRRNHRELLWKDIEKLKTKDDAVDYFRGLRYRLKRVQKRLERRAKNTSFTIEKINDLIIGLEGMADYSTEKLKSIIDSIKKELKDFHSKGGTVRD